jgi:acyl carrier protein
MLGLQMQDALDTTLSQRVDTIVREFIKSPERIQREQNLQDLGLTSMDMVNLMLSIEAEFDLTIPARKMVPNNFRTIENIEALLRDLGR